MKRPLIFIFSLICLFFATAPQAEAAEDTSRQYVFELTVDGQQSVSTVVGGEITFTLTLRRVDEILPGEEEEREGGYLLYAMQDELMFDSTVLEYVPGSEVIGNSRFFFDTRTMEDGMRKRVVWSTVWFPAANAVLEKTPDVQIVGSFTMRALESGDHTVSSCDFSVSTRNGMDHYSAIANDVQVHVYPSPASGIPAATGVEFIGKDSYKALPRGHQVMLLNADTKLAGAAYMFRPEGAAEGTPLFFSPAYSGATDGKFVYCCIVPNAINEDNAADHLYMTAGASCPILTVGNINVNGDDFLNSTDAVLTYWLFRGQWDEDLDFLVSPLMRLTADVNGDKTVDTRDAQYILFKLWGRDPQQP